jgi:hypothetical protein
MISPQVVTILRKRSFTRKQIRPAIVPRDYALEWRWADRADIAVFVIMALLIIWPLIDAATAVRLLPAVPVSTSALYR